MEKGPATNHSKLILF